MSEKKYLDDDGVLYVKQKIEGKFVAKDGKKVLSDNNYTDAEKEKLADLENYTLPKATTSSLGGVIVGDNLTIDENGKLNANPVVDVPIETISVNDVEQSIVGKNVNITVPTDNAALANGAGYQTEAQVSSAISSAIQGVTQFDYQIVQVLPATGVKGTIYLIANSGEKPNMYDEHIWINEDWEKFGTAEVDLSGFVKEKDLAAITNAEIDTIFA